VRFTLGWELEANRRARRTPPNVSVDSDGSVSGDGTEYKIQSSVVTNPTTVLEALRALTGDAQIRVDRTCGYHVHIGLQDQSTATERLFASWMVALARVIESEAFLAVPESRRNNTFCRRFTGARPDTNSVMTRAYSDHKYGNDSRYYWLNVVEMFRPRGIHTVEVRLLGNVRRFSYLLAWTSVCQLMAKSAWRLMSDPSAMIEETEKLKTYFGIVRTRILSNTNAQQTVGAANELAGLAGFTVRATAQTEPLSDIGLNPSPARSPRATRTVNTGITDDDVDPRMEVNRLQNIWQANYWFADMPQRLNSTTDEQHIAALRIAISSMGRIPSELLNQVRTIVRTIMARNEIVPMYNRVGDIQTYLNTLRTLLDHPRASANSGNENTNANQPERRSLSCVE
jgi:hypothetical protein